MTGRWPKDAVGWGRKRAAFWRSQDWVNLKRASYAIWTLYRRHWTASELPDLLADLEADQPKHTDHNPVRKPKRRYVKKAGAT